MPGSGNSVYIKEQDVMDRLKDLMPEEDDVIIIGSASNVKVAELAAKYAVLTTLLNMLHYTHNSLL
jgi:UDP-N-acetylenolpyruvoylglucosamine reductase